ncbi:MAG: undecaprenyldiphospho-muramoylpentapeptide beta-N-acetylglucosaminyltransferase [Chitinophagaceae bacterium]|nr:undecaprenyldiphospho-muramoylpentapeptide beta-N-acetylglucosaminyltransferase [Chitinophagaceae bacterium]
MGKRIVIAGGGTGGHIFPAIAIANALRQQDPSVDILFIGANGKMEMEKVPQAGYRIEGLDIAGFNRKSILKNIGLPFKLINSFLRVRKLMAAFKPDAVIGVGGYSTYPVLRYAQNKGVPTFIHEANSFAGKSNILLGKRATRIYVATSGMEKFFPEERIMITGNPVRKNIVQQQLSRQDALNHFGLQADKTTVLVIGGSLGAKSINDVIAAHITDFGQLQLQLIWQTGKHQADAYRDRGKPFENIWVDTFITEMDKAYAAADLVISRAGAMSVTEICVAGLPAIFVPYPLAAEDHQTVNAMHLVNNNAALLVKDEQAPQQLFATMVQLAKSEEKKAELRKNIKPFAITNADEVIAKDIMKYLV